MPYNEYEERGQSRQRDFVLNMNEFAHILNKTDGSIKCAVGPYQTSLSQQETPVIFNTKTKRFEECNDYDKAKQLFISAPEGWYVVLKNPTIDDKYPEKGRPNQSPNIEIGKKVNIFGPISFALFPGQMAKVVQGHRLRSNQYLLARVYDADAANKNEGVVTDAEGKEQKTSNKYFPGQLLVIKGTEISFYIPPTGIEVISIGNDGRNYVRDAVTLERLEYCILKNEDGNKRYVHGPAVVFPEPTETFVKTPHDGYCFRAIELSKISGIYIKVIAEYKDEKGTLHPIGEELFITGKDQMIYYPRPEHAIISYDGKYMHHAIAIPEGEGRYVMDRETGEIKTVLGPKMFLPDPRKEVIVKRKLTQKECNLWYPGNVEVAQYNYELNEKAVEKGLRKGLENSVMNFVATSAFSDASSMDCLESNAGISRGTSYTKPRTITLDNKFDGVVAINVWTGYAINVISKSGDREIVVGPTTKLLNYDETLETLELSTGKPKTTDKLLKTAYLRVENNKVADLIMVQTKDFVDVEIKVSYCVDFLPEYKDKWFSVDNYVKYLCDRQKSLLKRAAKQYNIEEFYANATDIVRNIVLNIDDKKEKTEDGEKPGRLFKENGMFVHDVEVLKISVERHVAAILEEHQEEMITKCLELSDAAKKMEVVTKLAEYEKKEQELKHANRLNSLELQREYELEQFNKVEEIRKLEEARAKAKKQAESDMQEIINAIKDAELERAQKADAARIETEKQLAEIEKEKQAAYADTVAKIMESIGPELVAALNAQANADIMKGLGQSVSPYAIANGESISETVNTLLRGTSLQETLKNVKAFDIE